MLSETGQVVDAKDGKAWVAVERKTTCESCAVQKGCGTSVLSKVIGKKIATIEVDNTLDVKVGDHVELAMNDDAIVSGSLMLYMLPLIAFFLMAILAHSLFSHELVTILSSLLGLAAAFFMLRRYTQSESVKKRYNAHLVAIDNAQVPHFSIKLLS